MDFPTALEGYWLAKRDNFSQNTVNDYTVTFTRFADHIGDMPVDAITATDVRRFLHDLREKRKLGKKTVCNAWTALSSFWTWAAPELKIEHVIRDRVDKPDYSTPKIEIYPEIAIKAMVGACEFTSAWQSRRGKLARTHRPEFLRDQAIIVTLIDTGVRASELCDFAIKDYTQQQGRLLVREGKGSKDRVLFLGQAGRRAVWRYVASRPGVRPNDYLFPSKSGRRLDRNNLRCTLQSIGERAGVTDVTVHRFRHTFAVNFLRNGGSVLELQEMLGHEKMETVRIYARLAETDLAAAQQRASVADNWRL